MPTISTFYGITVRMYYEDHAPPHFHVYYGEHEAVFEIASLRLRDGRLPRRAQALVLEWATQHRDELRLNWERAASHQPLNRIAPLE